MSKGLSVTTLGDLAFQMGEQTVTGFSSRKAEALLTYLVVERGNTHRRERLFTLLWPGMPESSARNNLRQVLFNIRQTLPEVAANGDQDGLVPLLLADRQIVQLNPEAQMELDIHQIDRLLDEVQVHDHLNLAVCETCISLLERVVGLYRGEFLAGFYLEDSAEFEEWAGANRQAYRAKVLSTLEKLAEINIQHGNYAEAKEYAEGQLKIDPLRESAYRQLMELYAKSGRRAQAIRAYQRCMRLLEIELGTKPSRQTTALYEIISGEDRQGEVQPKEGMIRGYQIREHLGSGHMGMVYRAFQPVVNRDVAVKVIAPQYANHPDFIRRFEVEAQLVARLEHPYIVPLYDFWRDPSGAYLVMRWLKGGSLGEYLKNGPWMPEPALALIDQVSSALSFAHRQGVVHCDIKPANIMLDEQNTAYLTDFGIATLTGPLAQMNRYSDLGEEGSSSGSLGYLSPELACGGATTPLADVYSLGVVLFELLTARHPFPGLEGDALIEKHLTAPLPSVRLLRAELPEGVDAVIQRATEKDPAQRYQDIDQLGEAFRGAVQPETVMVSEKPEVIFEMRNPYKGLRSFEEADSRDFFGRDQLVERLVARLSPMDEVTAGERFVAVVGPSGSGKSSVVKAGLIPAIRKGVIPGSEEWFIIEMTPGSHPLEELESALLQIATEIPEDLLDQLGSNHRGLIHVLKKALPGIKNEVILLIDQFEELFTLVDDVSARNHFLDLLVAAVGDPHSTLRLVVTLRADFYDRPLEHGEFGALVREATEVVLPLNAEELERAISAPAESVGVGLEPALTARIIQEVVDQPGALPLLQYALTESFEHREGHRLTLEAYEASGGVLGALGRRAEEIYIGLDKEEPEMARQLFLRLVTLGEGTEDTRRRVLLSEIESIDGDFATGYQPVIEQYGRYRLLTFDHDPATREPTVEVAHEALLREWPRLRGWLDESRDDIRMQRLLAAATREWQANRREDSYLLRGTRLEGFLKWAENTDLALSRFEQAFLDASLAARQERDSVELERQAREARLEQRSKRFLRALVGVFAVAAVVAVILSIFAYYQRNIAQTQAQLAQTQTQLAQDQARLASSRELSSAALLNLENDPELSILMALEAISNTHTWQAEEALHQSLITSRVRLSFPGDSVDYSPDGNRIATGDQNGMITIRDAATGEVLFSWQGHSEIVMPIAYSPDGAYLATAGEDMVVNVWDPATGEPLLTFDEIEGEWFNTISFNPAGTQIVAASGGGSVKLWDIKTGKLLLDLKTPDTEYYATNDVRFSPDGERLLTMEKDGELNLLKVWDIASGDLLKTYTAPQAVAARFAVNPDGTLLAFTNAGFGSTLWDWTASQSSDSGQVFQTLESSSRYGADLEFSPDGSHLANITTGLFVRVWDISAGEELILQPASARQLSFSPDGTHLATAGWGVAKVWDISPGGEKEWLTLVGQNSDLGSVAYTPDGTRLVTMDAEGFVQVWDAETGQSLYTLAGSNGSDGGVAVSPDGRLVATAGADNVARIWDLFSGQELLELSGHAVAPPTGNTFYGIIDVAFSPDSKLLATTGADGKAKLWNTDTGIEIMSLNTHPTDSRGATSVAFSPDGSRLVTGSDSRDGEAVVIIWDVATGKERVTLSVPGRPWALAFSPDGTRLVTGGAGGYMFIWDAETGEELSTISGHIGTVSKVIFIRDGAYLITSGGGTLPTIWDVTTGEKLFTLYKGGSRISLSPDGSRLATIGRDGTVRVYLLDVGELIELARSRVTRSFTDEECKEFLHMAQCP